MVTDVLFCFYLQVLSGRGRLILSQAACYPSLAALHVGRTRTFSAASSDEPYTHVSPTESGIYIKWFVFVEPCVEMGSVKQKI